MARHPVLSFPLLGGVLILLAMALPAAAGASTSRGGPFLPREHPSSEGSPVDAVIVTSAAMAPAFQVLADWHLTRGSRTVVRDLDWLAVHYPPGRDRGENIRIFLQEAHALWGLSTVILGGDSDVIPARYATSYASGASGSNVPTDLYYACLDGNWNGDGDARWCEADYLSQPGDDADLEPELWVGRLPVRNAVEATAMVTKLINCRESSRDDFQDRLLFLAEVLFPSTWTPSDGFEEILVDGGTYAADLVSDALTPAIRHTELFQSWESPTWDYGEMAPAALNVLAAQDSLNTGRYAFVDQNGHGFRYNMSVGDGSIGVPEALALTNSMPFHICLMNCSSTAFDFDCLAENLLRNPTAGAMAVFGTTRSSFPLHSWRYPDHYYRNIFRNQLTQPGAAIHAMRQQMIPIDQNEGYSRWTYLIMNFLGDPLLDLWAGPPRSLQVGAPAAAGLGWQNLVIHVEEEGLPAQGVRLTLSKPDEVWSTGLSDAGGDCNLPVQPLSPGMLELVAWGPGSFQERLWIPVTADAEAFPRLATWQIVDDPALDARNDDDGLLEAGESASFRVEIVNEGLSDSGPLTLRIESLSDSLTILSDQTAMAALAPGESAWSDAGLSLRTAAGSADQDRLRLILHLESGRAVPRSDTLGLVLRAPDYRRAEWRFTDVGNGDGIWDESEPWRAAPRWVNLGGGSGGALNTTLISLDPDLTVLEGSASLPALEALAEGRPDPGFLIQRVDPELDYSARLLLDDAFGRSWEDTLGFQAPPSPTALVPDASGAPDGIELSWESVNAADLAGYLVYVTQGSPVGFQRATLLPLPHTSLSLSGLLENSLTWLYVTAVDLSGMESASSDTLMTSTNPAQLTGFPQATLGASSSPPAVGNVAGDTGLELVVAADLVYVWHHDGSEPLDADEESETLGVFSLAARDMAGAVTLLPLLDNGYRQIVVAARDGGGAAARGIYVLDSEGQPLPGWPRATLDWVWANPIGADLDGDGDLEIAALDRAGNLYAFHHDGQELHDGDGDPGTLGILARGLGSYADGSPAAADLNADGAAELVVMGGTNHKWLHAFRADGSDLPGFPLDLDPGGLYPEFKESCPLLLADLDGADGGQLEIILHSEIDSLYVFRSDGSRFPGYPQHFITNNYGVAPGPAPVDIDGDGDLELFITEVIGGGYSVLHLIHHDGGELPGWPQTLAAHAECSPVIGDLDGDGGMEFILGSEQGILYGFREDGTLQPGFPIAVGGEIRGTPTLADLDGDGDVELLAATWNKRVLVWDFDGPFNALSCPWPTLSGNYYRNGLAGDWDQVPVAVDHVSLTPADPGARIAWRVADPQLGLWSLERRSRPAAGGDWSASQTLAEGLRPDPEGWCLWIDLDAAAGFEHEWRALAALSEGGTLGVPLGRLLLPVPTPRDRLLGAHPNPFNPVTTLVFEMAESGPVSLALYDLSGRLLRRLVEGELPAGRHERRWDGRDAAGRRLASGLYLARFSRPGHTETCRLLLLK